MKLKYVNAESLKVIYEANKHRICDDVNYNLSRIDMNVHTLVPIEYCDLRHLMKVAYRNLLDKHVRHYYKLIGMNKG